jgi:protoporphyrinogen oxidase
LNKKYVIILGAGPAGLTAAYELLSRTDYIPIIIEMSQDVGGLSKTVNFNGNYLDIGGHRFFTKNERVLKWWFKFLPPQGRKSTGDSRPKFKYRGIESEFEVEDSGLDPEFHDEIMLVRERVSRIYHDGQFFNYPVKINYKTLKQLGIIKSFRILLTYLYSKIFPRKENSLEDFYINRFGKELYLTFFKSYTEKVCGKECSEISPDWGRLRIKNISLIKIIRNYLVRITNKDKVQTEDSSLIESFLYPKFGPGQLWQLVADSVLKKGGKIHFGHEVVKLDCDDDEIRRVTVKNSFTGEEISVSGDVIISTIPIKELFECLNCLIPQRVREIAHGLEYRDFLSVGILLPKRKSDGTLTMLSTLKDNWIYIQDSRVQLGRVQIVNNWSPYMVSNPENSVWLCLEYFSSSSENMWLMSDEQIIDIASKELRTIGLIDCEEILGSKLIRVNKAYPSYTGTYKNLSELVEFTNKLKNLYLIGRNGMHFYNSQDHSILTAMTVADDLVFGKKNKSHLWEIRLDD